MEHTDDSKKEMEQVLDYAIEQKGLTMTHKIVFSCLFATVRWIREYCVPYGLRTDEEEFEGFQKSFMDPLQWYMANPDFKGTTQLKYPVASKRPQQGRERWFYVRYYDDENYNRIGGRRPYTDGIDQYKINVDESYAAIFIKTIQEKGVRVGFKLIMRIDDREDECICGDDDCEFCSYFKKEKEPPKRKRENRNKLGTKAIFTCLFFLALIAGGMGESIHGGNATFNSVSERLRVEDSFLRPLTSFRNLHPDAYLSYAASWRGVISYLEKPDMIVRVDGRKRVVNELWFENIKNVSQLRYQTRHCLTGVLTKDAKDCLDSSFEKEFVSSQFDIICNDIYNKEINLKQNTFVSDTELCSVNGFKLKQCKNSKKERELYYGIWESDLSLKFTNSLQIRDRFEPFEPNSYNCKNVTSGAMCTCKKGECQGTDPYCNYIGCGNKDCYCIEDMTKGRISVKNNLNQIEIYPRCLFISLMDVEVEIPLNVRKEVKAGPHDPCDSSVTMTFSNGKATVSSSLKKITYGLFCLTPSCIEEIGTSYEMEFTLTESQRITGGNARADLDLLNEDNSGFSCSVNATYTAEDYCKIIDCIICKKFLINTSCWTTWEWSTLLVVLFFATSILTCMLIWFKWVWIVIRFIFYAIRFGFRKGFNTCLYTNELMLAKLTKIEKVVTNDPKSGTGGGDNELLKKYGMAFHSGSFKKMSRFGIFALVNFLLVGRIHGCVKGLDVGSVNKDCVLLDSGELNCRNTFSGFGTLGPVGTDVCFGIAGTNGEYLGYFQLENTQATAVATLAHLYQVPTAPKVLCDSLHRCDKAGDCSSDFCSNFNNNPTTNGGAYWPASMSYFGYAGCDAVCGCAGCGCFYCVDSCLFWRKAINPGETFYDVRFPLKWDITFSVKGSFHFQKGNDVVTYDLGTKQVSASEEVTFTGVSGNNSVSIAVKLFSFASSVLPVENACYLVSKDESKIAYVDCAKWGEIVNGKVGEIQCNQTNNCYFKSDLISTKTSDNGAICNSNIFNVEGAMTGNQLPKKVGDVIVAPMRNPGGDSVTASVDFQYGTTTTLLLSGDYRTFGIRTIDTCTVEFVKLTGCYKCTQGASLTISSTCQNRDKTVGTITCGKSSAIIKPEKLSKETTVSIFFDQHIINMNCSLKCSGNTAYFMAKGQLVLIDQDIYDNSTTVVVDEADHSFSFTDLFDKWWFILSVVVVIILAIIITYSCVRNYNKDKAAERYTQLKQAN